MKCVYEQNPVVIEICTNNIQSDGKERQLPVVSLNLITSGLELTRQGLHKYLKFYTVLGASDNRHTVMILSFRTDMPGQTVQTQIRLLLEEQSDQGLNCLPFRLHRLDSLLYGRAT